MKLIKKNLYENLKNLSDNPLMTYCYGIFYEYLSMLSFKNYTTFKSFQLLFSDLVPKSIKKCSTEFTQKFPLS